MNKFKKFLANIKGSAFIESLMIYIVVGLIGTIVVGVIGKTIMDAADGSAHVEDFNGSGSGSGGSSASDQAFYDQYGIWPGTYVDDAGDEIVFNSDGTITYGGKKWDFASTYAHEYPEDDYYALELYLTKGDWDTPSYDETMLWFGNGSNNPYKYCMTQQGGCN